MLPTHHRLAAKGGLLVEADPHVRGAHWRDNHRVNYEDRTDLLPPDAVVGHEVLTRVHDRAAAAVADLDAIMENRATDVVPAGVIATFLAQEAAEGAPAPAVAAERLAAESGHAFGEQVLGPLPGGGIDGTEISQVLDGMYLLAFIELIDQAEPSFSNRLTARLASQAASVAGAAPISGALEEAMPLAWCVGFGAAVVISDRFRIGS